MSYSQHLHNIQNILDHKQYQHLTVDNLTHILAALQLVINNSIKQQNYQQLLFHTQKLLKLIIQQNKPIHKGQCSVADGVSIFKETVDVVDAMSSQNLGNRALLVIQFSMVVMGSMMGELKADRICYMIQYVQGKKMKMQTTLIEGSRLCYKQYIILKLIQTVSKNSKKLQHIITSYFQYIYCTYNMKKMEELIKTLFGCYGTLNVPILYHVIQLFMNYYKQQFLSLKSNHSLSFMYDPKIISLILHYLLQFKNKLTLQKTHIKNSKYQCTYCDKTKEGSHISYNITNRNHCYMMSICSICRNQLPEDKYPHNCKVLLPLGTGCYQRSQFQQKQLKQSITQVYNNISNQSQTIPSFVYSLNIESDNSKLGIYIMKRIMYEQSLSQYPNKLIIMLSLLMSRDKGSIRLKVLKSVHRLMKDWKQLSHHQLLIKSIKKRIIDIDYKVKTQALQIYLYITMNNPTQREQLIGVLSQIQQFNSQQLVNDTVRIISKHLIDNIKQINSQTLQQILMLFINKYAQFMDSASENKLKQYMQEILTNLYKYNDQEYTQLLQRLIIKVDKQAHTHNHDILTQSIPSYPISILHTIYHQLSTYGYVGNWANNPTLINQMIQHTHILKININNILQQQHNQNQYQSAFREYQLLRLIIKHSNNRNVLYHRHKQLQGICKYLIHHKLQYKHISYMPYICELVFRISEVINQDMATQMLQNTYQQFNHTQQQECDQQTILLSNVIIFLHLYQPTPYFRNVYDRLMEIWQSRGIVNEQHIKLVCTCWKRNVHLLLQVPNSIWKTVKQYSTPVYKVIMLFTSISSQVHQLQAFSNIFQTIQSHNHNHNDCVQYYRILQILFDKGILNIMRGQWSKYLFKGLLVNEHNYYDNGDGVQIRHICCKIIDNCMQGGQAQGLFNNIKETIQYLMKCGQQGSYLQTKTISMKRLSTNTNTIHINHKAQRMKITIIKKLCEQLTQYTYSQICKHISIVKFINRTIMHVQVLDVYEYRQLIGTYQTIVNRHYLSILRSQSQTKIQHMIHIIKTYYYLLQGNTYKHNISNDDKFVIQLKQVQFIQDKGENVQQYVQLLQQYYELITQGNQQSSTSTRLKYPPYKHKQQQPKTKGKRYHSQEIVKNKPIAHNQQYISRLRKRRVL